MNNSYDPMMKRRLYLMTLPAATVTKALEEGIFETVTTDGKGLRGVDRLFMEWQALNEVAASFNRSTNPGELKRLQVRR